MTKPQTIAKTTKILRKFYADNKNRGILAIYLWGSVLSRDFSVGRSDIDSIAFVEDKPSIEEDEAGKMLSQQLSNLHIRFVYVNELKGGNIKGSLAKFIDRRLLILDLAHWKYVTGSKSVLKNLKLESVTMDEAARLALNQIYRRNLMEIKSDPSKEKYFAKAMMRLCFYIQQQGKKHHAFSYSYVKRTANNKTRSVVTALFELRQSGYAHEIFNKNLPLFMDFLKAHREQPLAIERLSFPTR